MAPTLLNHEGLPIFWEDHFRGASVFLIAGGPSFAGVDQALLRQAGCLTLGLNNSPKSFRPNLWLSVDHPQSFLKSIWLDPQITKFCGLEFANTKVFDSDAWVETPVTVAECPNVLFYRRVLGFNAATFLEEAGLCVGDASTVKGGARSVLLAAIKLCYYLGFVRVFLLGVDFDMATDRAYHFEQERDDKIAKANMRAYSALQRYFDSLKREFGKRRFQVFNCNPQSKLTSFPQMKLEKAVVLAREDFPADLSQEPTAGMYERMQKQYQRHYQEKKLAQNALQQVKAKLAQKKADEATILEGVASPVASASSISPKPDTQTV